MAALILGRQQHSDDTRVLSRWLLEVEKLSAIRQGTSARSPGHPLWQHR